MITTTTGPALGQSREALELGMFLKAAREAAGLNLKDVVSRSTAPTSLTTLSLLENGRRRVSAPLLEEIVRVTGADTTEAFRLAGLVPPQAAADILGPDLAHAFRGGSLTPAARRALRLVRLAELTDSLPPVHAPPVRIEDLLYEQLGIDFGAEEGLGAPRFDGPEYFAYPRDLDGDGRAADRNFVLAHMAAHALLARDAARRPACNYAAGGAAEGEATWIAGLVLMPRVLLVSELQLRVHEYDVRVPSALMALIADLASGFGVPLWLAMRHIADAGQLAWAFQAEEP